VDAGAPIQAGNGSRAMMRSHRAAHRTIWVILGPVVAILLIVTLAMRPPASHAAHQTPAPEGAP